MNSKFFLLSAAIAGAATAMRSAPLESYTYEQWVADYKADSNRVGFSNGELLKRKAIFNTNIEMIRKHNEQAARGIHTWTMDVNKFADMTEEEFIAKFTGYNQAERILSNPGHFRMGLGGLAVPEDVSDLPTSVDWIAKGAVTDVKNQGSCGSCWAFAAATTFESHAFIQTGVLTEVSTQQLTSCTPNPRKCGGTGGCFGATAQLAFDYITNTDGLTSSDAYPYKSGNSGQTGACTFDAVLTPPVYKSSGYSELHSNNKAKLLETIANVGPVSVSVAANRFMFYGGGIFNGCTDANDAGVNHAVVAVGYDISDSNNSYLTIRNSWGSGWGEKGNIRLRLNGATGKETCLWNKKPEDGAACEGETDPVLVCGECGVLSDSAIPLDISLY